ncbi:MAG: cytochrome c-type biogenesis protein CcmH [Sulfurimicrobium sp.]|nr:cytochrome c-type biogenesis protein CcmH [Sulfurimicrobium sp.]
MRERFAHKLGMGVAALFLLVGLSAHAAQVTEEKLESETRDLSRELRCLVCQGESVWDSNSPLAGQMRDLVRERLRGGESPQQIKTYLQSRYGDFVLMAPPKHGLNWLLWLGPFVLLAVGGFLLRLAVMRWRKRGGAAPVPASHELSAAQREKIEAELAKLGDD